MASAGVVCGRGLKANLSVCDIGSEETRGAGLQLCLCHGTANTGTRGTLRGQEREGPPVPRSVDWPTPGACQPQGGKAAGKRDLKFGQEEEGAGASLNGSLENEMERASKGPKGSAHAAPWPERLEGCGEKRKRWDTAVLHLGHGA
eukprot:CAMPEP_0117680220 /NCGR_PEP_ID=MMETSP0804-20121206/18229_1 /TAXON_ID=1074897 /ORGANISM="Tetraselmis astigmatica, Strain CCMP880" /LENGTH=145 /DNA_ID=CAMNT_0005489689 /DNA_START=524 /DNA_END=957 /DNA_ORIENTATION=-